jgi:hypothetical protein
MCFYRGSLQKYEPKADPPGGINDKRMELKVSLYFTASGAHFAAHRQGKDILKCLILQD